MKKERDDRSRNAGEENFDLEAALGELPIFPLPQVVLFPGAVLPLHVFEPRYRAMLKDCVMTHGAMAVALVRPPTEPNRDPTAHAHPAIAQICGAGLILEHQTLADGRSNIVLRGVARVRLEELPFVPPYRRARAVVLTETGGEPSAADRMALVSAASSFATEVQRRDSKFDFRLPAAASTGKIADLCAHHLIVDADTRQMILEELDTPTRVQHVIRELALQKRAFSAADPKGSDLN